MCNFHLLLTIVFTAGAQLTCWGLHRKSCSEDHLNQKDVLEATNFVFSGDRFCVQSIPVANWQY